MATFRGSNGDDNLPGARDNSGDDLFLARGGSDTINGGAGDDVIDVDPGTAGTNGTSDQINGGDGLDTLILDGDFADYTVSSDGTNLVLTGPDGTLWPAETIHSVALASINGEFAEIATTDDILARTEDL